MPKRSSSDSSSRLGFSFNGRREVQVLHPRAEELHNEQVAIEAKKPSSSKGSLKKSGTTATIMMYTYCGMLPKHNESRGYESDLYKRTCMCSFLGCDSVQNWMRLDDELFIDSLETCKPNKQPRAGGGLVEAAASVEIAQLLSLDLGIASLSSYSFGTSLSELILQI
ncbi:unnamed protein product [Ilex paraguariensis]|uniref:Uncharacterized protein n=1 Tax=Ilex paraguariensis TaxID=185542 RepID=A0ABC8RRM7_9AQUA